MQRSAMKSRRSQQKPKFTWYSGSMWRRSRLRPHRLCLPEKGSLLRRSSLQHIPVTFQLLGG